MTMPISPNSKRIPRFVEEYCTHRNGTRAALDAGWPESWASVAASMLLDMPNVIALIAERDAYLAKGAELRAVDVIRDWIEIATADPSKVVKVRRVNCRYCNGISHKYQWNAREYAQACDSEDAAAKREKREPRLIDCAGGFDWRHNGLPNPDCPECGGEGVEDVFVADMATLAGPERRLIAGVKRTRDGLEVKMRDQDKARDNLARYLGVLVEQAQKHDNEAFVEALRTIADRLPV